MPGFDGTGPLGQGPMTGRGQGFCALTVSEENPGEAKGFAGLQAVPVGQKVESFENTEKEVINMPLGDGTGPAGLGPMTGKAAGFCAGFGVPGHMNPVMGRAGFYGVAAPTQRPYGAGSYSYGKPYGGRVNPWFRRGFGFGRGFGRGRGRGRVRFGY
ncbi:MAG: DUF5320 domain-containing protein [Phycisphaerae bacterium]|nr:DUF5320 domain-containing protein [Phycisphaerae bacterium]